MTFAIQIRWSSMFMRRRVIASSAERLVEQQHGRLRDEGPRDRHPLAHPARELPRAGGLEPLEAHQSDQVGDGRLRHVRARDLQRELDVVLHVAPRSSAGSWKATPTW